MADEPKPEPKRRGNPENLKPAWQPGQSGNPNGRQKGSRNKLGEAFLADMFDDWQANGAAAITKVREERPHEYLKVVASILPKELNLRVSELDDLSDDQIQRQLAAILAQLAAGGVEIGAGTGPEETPEPADGLSSVH